MALPADGVAVAVAFDGAATGHHGMGGGDVVEHAVEKHADPAGTALGDEAVEVGLVAQARVDAVVVEGVVAVGDGVEDRGEQQGVAAEFDDIVEPVDEPGQAVGVRLLAPVPCRGAGSSERIDVPDDGVIEQRHGKLLLSGDQ